MTYHMRFRNSQKIQSIYFIHQSTLYFLQTIVILALTKEGLKEKINKMEQFCQKWGLEVNISKTKIMIFNKPGATIKKYKFFFKSKEIESVKQYTYLGFTFVPSGKMNEGIENLLNKGKKAWFAIQRSLQKSKAKTVKTYLKLIDTLIKPIILYACEAWGDIRTKKLFENKTEKFHLSMCKQVLGVNKRSNNVNTLAELGRYPLFINIESQIFKYFQRFVYVDKNRFLYKAFQHELTEDFGEQGSWVTFIKCKLSNYGLASLASDICKTCKSEELKTKYKNRVKIFTERAKDTYLQINFHTLQKDRLTPLAKIKTGKYEIEKYLSLKSFENRRALSKLRIRSHNLLVETGKWYNIEMNQRICKQCDQYKIEDEFHLIFECPKYSELRINAFSTIEKHEEIDFTHDSSVENLQYFFSQASLYSINIFAAFIKLEFESRQNNHSDFSFTIII